MALANNNLQITNGLDFDALKQDLISYLQSQTAFQDYNFQGSGMQILLDILCYNTYRLSYYLQMVGNEAFLDSAVLRDSIVSHAKMIGYTPTSMTSPTAYANIVVTTTPTDNTGSLIIPRYTQFQSEAINGINYSFVTLDSYTTTQNLISSTFTFSNVALYEGEHFTYSSTVIDTSPQTKYTIPSANVDIGTLQVTIQASATDHTITAFNQANDVTEISSNSNVYFLQADAGGTYSIFFGDGFLGAQLSNGNIVIMDYIVTDGPAANYANSFSIGNIGSYSNVSVNVIQAATGGTLVESDEQVRFRAPYAYTAQNRAVTVNDYYAIVPKIYPNVDQISVWGGQDNNPVVYGKVFISIKPQNGFALTDLEKANLIKLLTANESVVTIEPEIVDPEYLYVLLQCNVSYFQSQTNLTPVEMSQAVTQSILNYFNSPQNSGSFNTSLKISKLQTQIDNTDDSIDSSNLEVWLQKQFSPVLNSTQNYVLNFNAPIVNGTTVLNKLYTYPQFQVFDQYGIARTAQIDVATNSDTGIFEINVSNPGRGYSFATVKITGDGTGATAIPNIVGGKIQSIQVITMGSNYTIASVTITGDGTGAAAEAVLSTNIGTLETYYLDSSGSKIIINANQGTVDFVNGIITLNNFTPVSITSNPFYLSGVLTFNALAASQIISPSFNTLIILDTNNPIALQVTSMSE